MPNLLWSGLNNLGGHCTNGILLFKKSDRPLWHLFTRTDNEDLKRAIASIANSKVLAIDTETTGLEPHLHKLRLVQIGPCVAGGQKTALSV